VGVTNNLVRRVGRHRAMDPGAFTRRYRITRLVYYETASNILSAIAREKQLKGLSRAKKLSLISSSNPEWRDLAVEWFDSRRA
jgi:putative endonuclease